MKIIAYILILVGFFLIIFNLQISLSSGNNIFEDALTFADTNEAQKSKVIYLDKALYKFVIKGTIKEKLLEVEYFVAIKDRLGYDVWSEKGSIESEKGNKLMQEVIFALKPFKIRNAGQYDIVYKIFPHNNNSRITTIYFLLKKDIINLPFYFGSVIFPGIILLGLFILIKIKGRKRK